VAETLIWCDATAAAFTLTLTSASLVPGSEYLFIKADTSANAVTLQRQGSDVFWPSGNTSMTLPATVGKFIRLLAFSNLWIVVGSN
jgi:hypothetical protein